MDKRLLMFFQGEVEDQCRLALIAAIQLEEASSAHPWFLGSPTAYVWAAIQGILVSTANISKLLWGSGRPDKRKEIEARRRPLRERLKVEDSSALNSTRLRNAFEHVDERIEDMFRESTSSQPFIARNVGPPEMVWMPGQPEALFGHYDPGTGILKFWERSMDIPAVMRECEALLARIQALGES